MLFATIRIRHCPTSVLTLPCRRVASTALLSRLPTPCILENTPHVHPSSKDLSWKGASIFRITSSKIWAATHKAFRQPYGRARPPPRGPQRDSFLSQLAQKINRIPSQLIFWGFFTINGAVFLLWNVAITQYRVSGDPYSINLMRENFTTSMTNIKEGRFWTLISSSFSQKDFGHILFNLFSYYYTAPSILYVLGNSRFLVLYLGGGLLSSLTSLWWNSSVKHNPSYSSHGASGALCGMISFFACLAPTRTFYIFGIIPCPAWLCVSGIFLVDGYSAVTDKRSGIDTAGHIGGILAGIGGYYLLRMRLR